MSVLRQLRNILACAKFVDRVAECRRLRPPAPTFSTREHSQWSMAAWLWVLGLCQHLQGADLCGMCVRVLPWSCCSLVLTKIEEIEEQGGVEALARALWSGSTIWGELQVRGKGTAQCMCGPNRAPRSSRRRLLFWLHYQRFSCGLLPRLVLRLGDCCLLTLSAKLCQMPVAWAAGCAFTAALTGVECIEEHSVHARFTQHSCGCKCRRRHCHHC